MNRTGIMPLPAATRVQRLQTLVEGLAARKHIPHAVLAVESMDRSLCWAGAAGHATPGGAPMTPDTPFFIASIDKTFVAAVAFMLHEQQALSIDHSIANYLAPDLISGLHRLHGVDYSGRITIRNLLGHTSGLADYLEDYPKKGPSLIERIFEGDDQDLTLEAMLDTVRGQLTPHFPPQSMHAPKQKARYSDTNFKLLGAIIQTVCKQPLHEVIAGRIFRPLDLQHTWYAGYSEPAAFTSPPALLWVAGKPLERPRLLRSLDSIYSTPGDLIAFLRALMRGEFFDDQGTLELMQGRWNPFSVPRDRAALRAPGWPIEYALGLKRFRLPRLFNPFSPMPAVIGHSGSTGTWLFYCPKLQVFIAGAVNQATAGAVPYRLLPKVLKILGHG